MNIARVEKKLIVVTESVGVLAYDFNFDLHFACSHPNQINEEERCVLRIGPVPDYSTQYAEKLAMGLRLVNSPKEHALASELENWYPLLNDLTPRTQVFNSLPNAQEIESNFEWPVFMKGSRQTSKHNPDLSIIRDQAHYERASEQYRNDAILHWQKPVIREFVRLAAVSGSVPGKVQPSVEYRSFWWAGHCVGWGRYWYQVALYECHDIDAGLAVARDAASRLAVPFLVVDFAKTFDGHWIIIECNDAQESGYAAIPPQALWQEVLTRIEA